MNEFHTAPPQEAPPDKLAENVYDVADVIVSAVLVILVIFTFLFRFVGVVGDSMAPTLQNGNWLLVSSGRYEPVQGDIVIITQPNYFHEPIVKRVIATAGQRVDIDLSSGAVLVDGKQLDEPYIAEPVAFLDDVEFPVTVPEGCIFVMGDNRNHSTDSRSTKIGFIDIRYVLGKAKGRCIPLGHWSIYQKALQ